jgi:hypothetical protein
MLLVARVSDFTGMKSIEGIDVPNGTMRGLSALLNISSNRSPKRTLRGCFEVDVDFGMSCICPTCALTKKPDCGLAFSIP